MVCITTPRSEVAFDALPWIALRARGPQGKAAR
jgi:hypothetical protein